MTKSDEVEQVQKADSKSPLKMSTFASTPLSAKKPSEKKQQPWSTSAVPAMSPKRPTMMPTRPAAPGTPLNSDQKSLLDSIRMRAPKENAG